MIFDRFAERLGVTNGEITRAQFLSYFENKDAKQGVTPAGASGAADPNADRYAKMAEFSFRALDKNGDGRLDYNEMPEDLRAELSKWDTNGNGTIELEEYKAYYIAKREQRRADWSEARAAYGGAVNMGAMPVMPGQATPGKADPKKPLVYTKNNLPKDLPPWFRDLADADAQIAFFEWRAAGRSLDEFRKYDLNNDGFITVDEVLAFQAQSKKATGNRPSFTVVQGGETIAGSPAAPTPAPVVNVPGRFDRSNFQPGGAVPVRPDRIRIDPSQFDPNRFRGGPPRIIQGGGTPTIIQGGGTPTK
jgi:hypothetical protein